MFNSIGERTLSLDKPFLWFLPLYARCSIPHRASAGQHILNESEEVTVVLLLFATTRSVFKSVKVSVVEIAKRTN